MSGLTDGFERMRGTAKAAADAKIAASAKNPRRFADVLTATPPDASDIAAIYTHLATATTANCDDIAEGYANDDYPHAYLLAVKPSANSDTPYMLPIFGMATFRTDADHNMRGKVLAWTENGGGSEGVPASLVVRGSWLGAGEPFALSVRLEFDKPLVGTPVT